MHEDKPNPYNPEFNKFVINKSLTLNELKVYLNLRFPSVRQAGVQAGISETRVRQILIGYNLPRSAKLISRIARGWDIDAIKLTLLFENARREQYEQVNFESADKFQGEKNGNNSTT